MAQHPHYRDPRQHHSHQHRAQRGPGGPAAQGPAHPRHTHRRPGRNAARLGIAGGVTGVAGVLAVAGLIFVLRGHHGPAEPAPRSMAARTDDATPAKSSSSPRRLSQLKMGTKLDLTTPDGFSYSVAAVKGDTADRPLASTRTPPPQGSTLAYADYVLTNTGTQPALLDFPADLFVKRSRVPMSAQQRCMPQPGAPSDACTLPDHTDVVNTLGFAPPRSQDGDQYIPAGASYLVRVATDLPVSTATTQRDLGLYVWDPHFTPDRHAMAVPFPG